MVQLVTRAYRLGGVFVTYNQFPLSPFVFGMFLGIFASTYLILHDCVWIQNPPSQDVGVRVSPRAPV
jgi:hypothetical protein